MTVKHESFEWDADKAVSNVRKHGVSFDAAAAALRLNPWQVTDQDERPYGEARMRTIVADAVDASMIYLVVWTPRTAKTRIISVRPANRKERNRYVQ